MTVAAYDIGEVMDALAAVFNGVETGLEFGGVAQVISCQADVPGQITVPAIVLELDTQSYDLNMGDGADSLSVIAAVLVQYSSQADAQRALWSFLSRKATSGVARLKNALEANQTLGGLVSYAIISGTRDIGIVSYNGIDYFGAELIIEVMS